MPVAQMDRAPVSEAGGRTFESSRAHHLLILFNIASIMKAVIQKVKYAKVSISGVVVGEIKHGLLVFLGIERSDTQQESDKLLDKILNCRIFSDTDGKMNLSAKQVRGQVLVISQFTLSAIMKGNRPSFSSMLNVKDAKIIYDYFILQATKIPELTKVSQGKFGAMMEVSLLNDGPVTFLLNT